MKHLRCHDETSGREHKYNDRRRGDVNSTIIFADLELDKSLRVARRAGRTIAITPTEYDLLILLLKYPQQILTRETLIIEVWGTDAEIHPNTLDVYVRRLRQKLGDPPLIHTSYGVGYVLKEETV